MLRERDGRVGMGVQRPKAPAELLVLLDRHLLVAEEDHQVVHQRIVHFLELLVAQRLAEIDTEYLRPDARRQLAHFDRLIGHWRFLPELGSVAREDTPAIGQSQGNFAGVRITDLG